MASPATALAGAGARERGPAAVLCVVLLASAAGLYALTDGLTAWTLDQRRAQRIAAGTMRLPPIAVRDQLGRAEHWFGADAPADTIYLVDFIYTRCMTVCRALGAEFAQLQARIAADGLSGRIGLRSLSFDARDGVADLAGYGREHRARLPDWRIAAGAPVATEGLLRAADILAIPDGLGGFEHNGGLHVVDARGRILRTFTLDAYQDAYAFARTQLVSAPSASAPGRAP